MTSGLTRTVSGLGKNISDLIGTVSDLVRAGRLVSKRLRSAPEQAHLVLKQQTVEVNERN